MAGSKALRFGLVAAALCIIFASGCSDSGPSGPDTIVGDLWIAASCYCYPAGGPSGSPNSASVTVRQDTSTGAVVSDVSVAVNGTQLTYSQSLGCYRGAVPSLTAGQSASVSVSDGLGTATQAVQVPYAPLNLNLTGGSWDISNLSASNTLTWLNPGALGQKLAVFIWDYDGGSAALLGSPVSSNPNLVSLTIYNSQLAYYATIAGVRCEVFQVNEATFTGQPAGSSITALAGVWGDWPVSSAID